MSTECSTIRKPNAVIQGMARHPSLYAFILAVIVSIIANYGDSFGSKPVEVLPKEPKFWFPPHQSIVIDSPRGSLLPVVTRLRQDDIVFVMFYAPWCSRSLEVKVEFEKAAAILQGKVTFAAVNCWWSSGDCYKQYKFLMFPAFLVYHTNLDGFKFIGVPRADHMVRFVERLLYPVTLVSSTHQAQELITRYDFVVFGYFDLTSDSLIGSYRQFYYASMRILEKDPFQPIHFAVVSNPSIASKLHLHQLEDIVMAGIGQNTTVFPFTTNITCTSLVTWALLHKGMPAVKRLSPLGIKSLYVSSEVNKGPALIMFHQEDVLFNAEPGMRVLKDVALQYRSCNLSREYKGLHLIWKKLAQDDIHLYQKVLKMCRSLRKSQFLLRNFPCCVSAVIQTAQKNNLICDVCKASNHRPCKMSPHHASSILSVTPRVEECHSTTSSMESGSFNVCCQNSSHYEFNITEWVGHNHDLHNEMKDVLNVTSSNGHEPLGTRRLTDRYYRDHLERLPRRLCSRLSIHKQDSCADVGLEHDVDGVSSALVKHFRESSCGFNRTLNFYSIDAKSHWMFSQRLGLTPESLLSSPGVVIFDKHNEEHFIMKENLTVSNTMSFILNFQQGSLQRHTNAHKFDTSECGKKPNSICVMELDSKNFLEVVKDSDKDVVVLIYAHWCGYCHTLSHTFLAVARYFSTSKYISFVRINGDTNDLPWEYTVDAFPSVLFFPAHRKADSVMFPPWKEKSLTNLVRFILRHTTFDTRLLLAADVCSQTCISSNLQRSMELFYQLRGRHMRTHVKLKNILQFLTGDKDKDYYFSLMYEYLSKHLVKLHGRVENVKKLIEYLRRNKNGVVDRDEMVALFGV